MKRHVAVQTLIFLIIAGLLLCCGRQAQGPKGKQESSGAAPVKVMKVVRQRISEKMSFTGTIEPWRKQTITPDIGGKVAQIYVKEGDRVSAGQLLAEMDTETLRLQIKQAEAGAAVTEAAFNDAKKDKERMDRLLKEKAVSEQQSEKVKLAFEAAQAQRDQAVSGLNLARHALDVSIMKAPFGGVIASKNAEVGDVINPMMGGFSTSSGVLTLMDFSKVKLVIEVTPNDIGRIRMGQKAILRTPSFPNRDFEGIVRMVGMTAEASTKKFRVEIATENPDLVLRPGTFGNIHIEVNSREGALAIPQNAILENRYVFVASGNKALRREVTIGLQSTTLVEVLNGIQEGELVIVEGNFGLEDGTEIQITEEVKQ
jgi:RND family efflux transporter MFP subunit